MCIRDRMKHFYYTEDKDNSPSTHSLVLSLENSKLRYLKISRKVYNKFNRVITEVTISILKFKH